MMRTDCHFKCHPLVATTALLIAILIHCGLVRTVLSQNLTITPSGPQCSNNPVLLTCKEFEFTAIKWRNGSTLITNSTTGRYGFNNNHTVLMIQNITHYDNGSVITCGNANNSSSKSNPVTILVYELSDRPKNVRFTNITLNSFMVTWEGDCDMDKSPVIGYNISWYNGRDILGSLLVSSLCQQDSQNEFRIYVANFTSELAVDFVSVSAENICGVGEATNITNGLPVVTVKPSSHSIEVTRAVIFTATATGVGVENFTYQWLHNGSFIAKQNGTTLTITNITERDGGNYSCLVTNIYGSTMLSNVVTLIVSRNLPVIIVNPIDKMIKNDSNTESVSFTCEAEGATVYKWEKQGGGISSNATGINTNILTIHNIQPNDTGYYRCIASNASGSSFSDYAVFELFDCEMETDNIYGLNWPNTKTGELAIVKCSPFSITIGDNVATRLCNNNNIWDKINVTNCESSQYSDLLFDVQKLGTALSNNGSISSGQIASTDSENKTDGQHIIEFIADLATLLSYYTRPIQNKSILPLDIGNINNILSSLLMVSEMEPSILNLENFVNDTANAFSNILDVNNIVGWDDLLSINESISQQLLLNSEKFSLQLANHAMFLGIRNIDIVEDNIVISTKVQMEDFTDIIFPSQDTMLNSNFVDDFGMPYASIVIPSSILKNTSSSQGSVAVGSVLYQTISRLLPNHTINDRNDTKRVASIVLSTQILGGASFAQGQYPIELNFQLTQTVNNSINVFCGFFDENINGSGWSTGGLTVDFLNDSHVRCLSTHLTTFAVLFDFTGNTVKRISKTEIDLLNIFTYIGCGISLICLALTIVILLIFFKSLLKDLHYFVHFNLSIALFMGLTTFLAGIDNATKNNIACTIVAALLHYFFTAVFTWMMCEGIMIYLLFVKVFATNITNKRWPFLLLGWGTPLLIVGIAVGVAHDGYGNEDYCWLSIEKRTIWGFVGPVLLFIIVNLIFLILGVKATLKGRISRYQATGMEEELNKFKIAKWLLRDTLFLLPMFGITWVFGLLAFNENLTVFAWLFVLLNSTQGFLIFLLYILRQKKVREKLHMLCMCCTCGKPITFTVVRHIHIPMFNLTKSHNHKPIDPTDITIEVNHYVADPL